MATYTIIFGELIEFRGKDFLNKYPLFSEGHREHLNSLIVDHYYNREIAHETPEMFFPAFRVHMARTMPVFNKMYEAELIEFNPLVTTKLETRGESEMESSTSSSNEATSISESESTAKSSNEATSIAQNTQEEETATETASSGLTVGYQFPQNRLAGNKDYASSASDSDNDATVAGNSSSSTNENRTDTGSSDDTAETIANRTDTGSTDGTAETIGKTLSSTVGYQGVPSELISAFRANLISVDDMVLSSLEPLFMGIWGTNTRRIGRY